MNAAGPNEPADGIEPGKRLIRLEGDKGLSLTERLAQRFHRFAWRTPFHALRLRGRHPLKLLGVPKDPIPGDEQIGRQILAGQIVHRGEALDITTLDLSGTTLSPALADHLQSFAWLRDLAAAASYKEGAPVAEAVMRKWLSAHARQVTEAAWRPDLWGRRILFWTAHAPLILSSGDLVYRSAVLNALARGARHLDRSADKAPQGLPRIAAWAGTIAAGLLIPNGDMRLAMAEEGIARALALSLYEDGGLANRSPLGQLELIELLAQLRAVYDMAGRDLPDVLARALATAVPALLGVALGDGSLSSWQGSGPVPGARIEAAVAASGIRARPLRQARDWGYQSLSRGQTRLVLDAAPPPVTRLATGGCASTLAFELSDGPHRLIVNCGTPAGAGLPPEFAAALRTTAAHSTLIVADSNSTAIHPDGSLGRGVAQVELDRKELESASRIEAAHDGYVRRYGFLHRRTLTLSADGRELAGEDLLLPAGRRRKPSTGFAVRFHLAPGIAISETQDGLGALLRLAHGAFWQFRCRGGTLAIEDSVWIDATGRPHPTSQLVISGEAVAGGTTINWLLRRAA
ncbi:heparinase [Sphingomonas oleivorans]|uniref:Heparinase n=1 Tax=Sphingomonas oleivorans TaxID=1735121 RepID=A0A2T5G2R0_9SPHN|nr:heparinase II/III family protein [Sphingomonas oleivorans]PTQ13401.1 heparinase [Sphingomonas oleivorans]